MSIKSLGNPRSTYNAVCGQTAKGAVTAGHPGGITATGGTKSTADGYTTHTFLTSGSFIVSDLGNKGGTVEYLIVAGGGGGGSGDPGPGNDAEGGGGGAAGVYSTDPNVPAPQRQSPITVSVTTYPVVIGAGGEGAPGSDNGASLGGNGDPSSALGATVGGGGGGGR